MAQQPGPQGSFVNALSEPRYTVEHFYAQITTHRSHHQQGNAHYHQPEDYKVHRVSIIKRYLWIQHETLVFEIHHNQNFPHPPFYIRVDRSADHADKSQAFDRVICSPVMLALPRAKVLWTLVVTINNDLNANTFDLVRLAALLCATRRIAPDYKLFGHNSSFWHTSATTRVIQDRILAGQEADAQVLEDLWLQWCCFRRHRCLGRRVGIPTDAQIQDIHHSYVGLLAIEGIQEAVADPL